VVRAGRQGSADLLFLKENSIALSDSEMGDLKQLPDDRASFYQAYANQHPDALRVAVAGIGGKYYRFVHEIAIGDIILYPSLIDRHLHCAVVKGRYSFRRTAAWKEFPHRRGVEWLTSFPLDALSVEARRELGAARTLFLFKRHVHEAVRISRLEKLLG